MTTRPELNREIATTADGIDITRGYTGPLLTPFDSVLRARGGDLRIYEQVLSDPEVKTCLQQRQLAVTKCEWQVDAASDRPIDQAAAEFIRTQIERIGFDNVTTKMLYGVFYGFAVSEIIYGVRDRHVVMDAVKVRNRRRFRFAKEGGLRLLTMDNMLEGIPADPPYFWHYATGADHDDEPYGLGLAHWLYWPVLFKRNGIKFWLIFLEKFGAPTGVGRYDANATDAERARLLQAVQAIQTDSGIIMPKDMEISLLEAARSGSVDYKSLHDTMNETIQKVILGQTASTQGTAGRLGNDDLQSDVRSDIITADADLVCESLNLGPIRWLTEVNFRGAEPPRVYRVTDPEEDLAKRAERDAKVMGLGYKPSLDYVRETYGEGWEPAAPPRPGIQLGEGAATDPLRFAAAPDNRLPVDAQAQVLAEHAEPVWADVLAHVQQLVNTAEDLSSLRSALLDAYGDLPRQAMSELLAMATAAAELAGRYDARQESTTRG